ncbi:hypothetical protein SADUNF_Sadunf08G0138200 [Salix dunnii]|uniref:Uncharacterized protein n=1 Tax=Salix dunnii TaxID=1413687 RepID=A0A835MV00_9ROSI|nr:hypothetical protein SADUNF_Sadunf08G0138200 [Salix dunnii]
MVTYSTGDLRRKQRPFRAKYVAMPQVPAKSSHGVDCDSEKTCCGEETCREESESSRVYLGS